MGLVPTWKPWPAASGATCISLTASVADPVAYGGGTWGSSHLCGLRPGKCLGSWFCLGSTKELAQCHLSGGWAICVVGRIVAKGPHGVMYVERAHGLQHVGSIPVFTERPALSSLSLSLLPFLPLPNQSCQCWMEGLNKRSGSFFILR